jgi:hypothetical protein
MELPAKNARAGSATFVRTAGCSRDDARGFALNHAITASRQCVTPPRGVAAQDLTPERPACPLEPVFDGSMGPLRAAASLVLPLLLGRGGERHMCHHLSWEEWELLRFEERREEEEPRVIEVTAEPDEALEAEPERDRERELIRA